MEDYRLEQSGQEVQDILNGAAMQSDLTAETERATEAEQTLQGNIDIEERDRKAADLTLQGNIDAEELRAKAAEKQNADDIDALEEKVPSGASASNKLATESYVDDSVATATATFRGTYNLVSDLHLTVNATEQQIATALALSISTADNNDYCFVQVPTSSETPTEIKEIDRYKFNGTAWSFEYKLNNSGFTAAQWAAINSGITSGDVTKLAALPTNAQLTALLAGKQDVLTFDNVPTEGSSHPVKSGGVYSAINDEKTARETADSSLSSAIEAILLLIPSAATSLNKLADKAFVNSSIATASATFRGTYNLVNDLSLTVSATHAQIATALAGAVSDEDNNDYAFVQIPTSDATPTQIAKTERYKFNGTAWEYEYDLNNSGYTAAQWAAINSGITEALVNKLSALPTNADLTTALGVLTSSITTINQKIPSAASQSNKLVDTATMESYIVQVLDVITASFNVTSSDGHVTVQISQVDGKITSFALTTLDIASAASLSLIAGRVTTAEGNISTNAADIANLQDAYAALTQSALVVIAPTDTWPVANPEEQTIYRVVDRVNTPPQYYSDYMWNGTTMVLMATYNNAIDPRPKKASQNLVTSGGVFDNMGALDVSELNATENPHTLAQYVDLSSALAAVPTDYQKGGMSVKFVQSSDNKYVQYRLMKDTWSTAVSDWQGVDDEPIAESDNLVKSGGVYDNINFKINASNNQIPSSLNMYQWVNDFPLQNIKKGDKLYARFKPLTNESGSTSLNFAIRFFYSSSDNNHWVIDNSETYYLNTNYYFEFDVVNDCADGYPQINFGGVDGNCTFELELYKAISVKDSISSLQSEVAQKQDILTFDEEPTLYSENPVKSNGVFDSTNIKINASNNELPTSLNTQTWLNDFPLQNISKGDKLYARFKPLTSLDGRPFLYFAIRFFYSQSDNNHWLINSPDPFPLNKDYFFSLDVVNDCAEGYPLVNIGCLDAGGTFELEIFKMSSVKEEIGKKQDELVSGENIKTINGLNILGGGNLQIDSDNQFNGKKILWLGTSIPCGVTEEVSIDGYTGQNNYPKMVEYLLGATVYNEAVGGSRIAVSVTPDAYNASTNPIALSDGSETMFPCFSSLGATIAEKDYLYDNWASLYTKFTDGTPNPPITKEQMEEYSFEKKVIEKYIADNPSISKVDLIVIEHGFNDRHNTAFGTMPQSYSETERLYYKGAMSYLIRKIYELNSRAHIVLPTIYSDLADPTHVIPSAIKDVAEKYNIPCIDYSRLMSVFANGDAIYTRGYWDANGIWHETGFTWQEDSSEKGYTTNDNGFCSTRPKSDWTTIFDVHQVTANEDLANAYPVGTLVYKCPRLAMMVKDIVHPHTDNSGYLNMQIARYLAKQLKEVVEF